jgi:hypothetical protein
MASSLSTWPHLSEEKKWWIAVRGVSDGPYSAAFILVSLKAGILEREALACLVGTQQWRPIGDWTDFGSSLPPPLPAQLVQGSGKLSPAISPKVPSGMDWPSTSAPQDTKGAPKNAAKPAGGLGLIAICVLSLLHLLRGCNGPTTEPQQPAPTGSQGKQVSHKRRLDICDSISAIANSVVVNQKS